MTSAKHPSFVGKRVAIFLDTNILHGQPRTLDSGELSRLVASARECGVDVLVAEVVVLEWWHLVWAGARKSAESLIEASAYLSGYLKNVSQPGLDWKALFAEVTRAVVDRIKAAGLGIAKTPTIDFADTLHRAAFHWAPFRDGDKGFKDDVIVCTMIEHAREEAVDVVVFVTQDKVFEPGYLRPRFADAKADILVVPSIGKAQEVVDGRLDEERRKAQAEIEGAVKELAEAQWDDISASVVEEIEREGFYVETVRGDLPIASKVRRLVSVEPQSIQGVAVGGLAPDGKTHPVTIIVDYDATLEVEMAATRAAFMSMVVTKEERTTDNWLREPRTEPIRENVRVRRAKIVEAVVQEVAGKWQNLHLAADKEEWRRLLRLVEASAVDPKVRLREGASDGEDGPK